uniref:hypothetical protein n=1 Tax=Cupriavidus pauculus TaxID=82633 RepID=UPI0030F6AB09
ENLLEAKSRELYFANIKLKEQAMHFEAIAEAKTKELLQALESTKFALELSQLAEVKLSADIPQVACRPIVNVA